MPAEIAGIGVTCIDHVSIVTRTPDGWEQCGPPLAQGGGLTATASVAAARLGASIDLYAAVGDDYHGQMIKRELSSQGVGVDGVRLIPGMRTPTAFIEVDSKTGDRTIYFSPGRYGPMDESALGFDPEAVGGVRSLLVDSLFPKTAVAMARVARRGGAKVVGDFFFIDGPNEELVSLVDALILPEETGIALAGGPDFPRALRIMAERGPEIPAVTVGARGCWYMADGAVYHCPAFPVEVVDTTGCGDSFHGAFAFALSRGMDAHESVRFSSAIAALKATKLGGRSGLPTFEEVSRFLAERSDQARAHRVARGTDSSALE